MGVRIHAAEVCRSPRHGVLLWLRCWGGGCWAPGSKCCDWNGQKFPLPPFFQCPNEIGQVCLNREGVQFFCSFESSCCGDICAGPGSSCCVNQNGNNFVCGAGTRCNGNACAI